MSRLFKGYASAYRADQVQVCRVRRSQARSLTVDFRAALASTEFITSVTWECTAPQITALSNPAVASDQRSVSVDVDFNYSGFANVKATVTASDGLAADRKLNYEFQFTVADAPIYPSATYSPGVGPYSVTAEYTP